MQCCPDRSEASVRSVLSGVLSKDDVLLCTDGDPALIAFAKRQGIEYELIIASRGEHVHEKVLHIQNVNSYISRFQGMAQTVQRRRHEISAKLSWLAEDAGKIRAGNSHWKAAWQRL